MVLLGDSHLVIKDRSGFVLGLAVGLAHFVTSTWEALGILVHLKCPALTNLVHTQASSGSPCPQMPSYTGGC